MGWFNRLKEGITTATKYKKEAPDGFWFNCNSCKETYTSKELKENLYVCPKCGIHTRVGSRIYFEILFGSKFDLLFEDIVAKDILDFEDLKKYDDRLTAAKKKSKLNEAISVATGSLGKIPFIIAAMDFSFIGGSMGSAVGEKISKSIDYAIENKMPFMIISQSGGARMMESAFSLMQMARTSAKLSLLAKAKLPYISFMTNPTTGGVTASYAMLGDINIAEPKALIGFAGPRVVKDTIKKELPEGFQSTEFLLDHGFLDFIVERKDLKNKLINILQVLTNQ